MNNLTINHLRVDARELFFRNGINFIVGDSGSGKTTIFNAIKYVLGLTRHTNSLFAQQFYLDAKIGPKTIIFQRNNGSSHVEVRVNDETFWLAARSQDLNEFYIRFFAPHFFIGNNFVSIFPILDFCFLTEEVPLNSKNLWSAIRMICGANDSLLTMASKDIEVLREQIKSEQEFLSKNDRFLHQFFTNLRDLPDDNRAVVDDSISSTRQQFQEPLREMLEILSFSERRLSELTIENEGFFNRNFEEIESEFSNLVELFSQTKNYNWKVKDAILRKLGDVSFGETMVANFLVLVAVARADAQLNFPGIYINDSFLRRSLDDERSHQIYGLLNIQARQFREFQYIEFTSDINVPPAQVAGQLSGKERWA